VGLLLEGHRFLEIVAIGDGGIARNRREELVFLDILLNVNGPFLDDIVEFQRCIVAGRKVSFYRVRIETKSLLLVVADDLAVTVSWATPVVL